MIAREARTDPSGPGGPVLIGHSHSESIFAAAKIAGTPLDGFNFWTAPQPALNADRTAFHPDIAERLSRGTVISAVGGAVHNIIGLVRHPVAFDFILPERPDLPLEHEAMLIPYATIQALVAHHLQEYLEIIGLVRAASCNAVFHIEAPPPLANGDRVLGDVPWMFFPDLTREVSPASLRYKLWRVASALTAQYCSERGIAVIPHPPGSVDEHGFLKQEYYADAMHVNTAYGALVLAQVEARIGTLA